MSEPQYVSTTDIEKAVSGRETDVLDGLGIDWRAARPHITCPYPDHDDNNPSWRWDGRRKKAFCTCSAKPENIFGVVTRTTGCDFGAAKLRVAEILQRDDLIRTRTGSGGQKTDARSLLGAKPANCDDSLPFIYLAHRLQNDEATVPRPTTPVRGIKRLAYFDPPKPGSKDKPELVGEFPCAVFGAVAADGQMHAHRIYLARDGHSKADLGIGPNGRPRNPKKSAKATNSDNTAGRSVIWGAPQIAPHIILTEGIETGAAVALAFKAEIVANDGAVAAAISAVGIEAFQPYPNTMHVTVAADRDAGKGRKRGEQAARAFGLKNCDKIDVLIALPGQSGESIDWLDILVRDGPEAVHAGIRSATPFEPTPEEINAAVDAKEASDEIELITQTYPLPIIDGVKLSYRRGERSRQIMIHRERMNPETGKVEQIAVSTPVSAIARLRFVDHEDAYGLRCVVQDMAGNPRKLDLDRGEFAANRGQPAKKALFEAGLRTELNGEATVLDLLKRSSPETEIAIVHRPGWHRAPAQPHSVFIAPNGEILSAERIVDLELALSARMSPQTAKSGTLEDWCRAVEIALAVHDCPHWTLGVVGAFAGPIVELTGLDTLGIDFTGRTSSGKTLAQRLAASAWSTPDHRRGGLFQSARATVNAMEALAQRASGTVLALDDLGNLDAKQVSALLYAVSGGAGKRRMRTDGTTREPVSWVTFAILSSECSLEEKVRSVKGEWLAGMAARIVDIDVTDVNRHVPADTLAAIRGIEKNFGHAGPVFVQALIDSGLSGDPDRLLRSIRNAAQKLAGQTADSATLRAAMSLAVLQVAGYLAQKFELIPSDALVEEACQWAWNRFGHSSDAEPLNLADMDHREVGRHDKEDLVGQPRGQQSGGGRLVRQKRGLHPSQSPTRGDRKHPQRYRRRLDPRQSGDASE
jgi:hypothetical protein